MGRNLVLEIVNDIDAECPSHEEDNWTVIPFLNDKVDYQHPSEVVPDPDEDPEEAAEFRRKLDTGLAFFLDCYQHSGTAWSLRGEGMQCGWDTSRCSGLIVWECDENNLGPKTKEDRAKDARAFLTEYNAWANGHVYRFHLEGDEVSENYGGWVNEDAMMEEIAGHIEDGDTVRIRGEAAWLLDYHPIKLRDGITATLKPQKKASVWVDEDDAEED